ncbi:MAG: S-layer homology domain-containing protein [Clostridia bacterium]|nr:S-layer homology domain-containing protein [Clostridia bacterium]
MKTIKKLIPFTFFIAALAVCFAAFSVFADGKTAFTDVDGKAYYYDAVLWATGKNVTQGITATQFGPERRCTRAQIVTFLWRAAGEPEPSSGGASFHDTDKTAYYYDAVKWAVEKGVTNGTGDNLFSPNAYCTRAQIVTFLWRAQGRPKSSGSVSFSDVANSSYYYNAVLWAVGNKITVGTSETAFSPDKECTRGQAVTFIYRAEGTKTASQEAPAAPAGETSTATSGGTQTTPSSGSSSQTSQNTTGGQTSQNTAGGSSSSQTSPGENTQTPQTPSGGGASKPQSQDPLQPGPSDGPQTPTIEDGQADPNQGTWIP